MGDGLGGGLGEGVTITPGIIVGEGVGIGERVGVGVITGVGVGAGVVSDIPPPSLPPPSLPSDDGVGEGEGIGLGEGEEVGIGVGSVRTILTVLSIPPAVIKNSPGGTPSVSMQREKSPFESAVTLIDVATFRFTDVASSAASPDISISLLPGSISISVPDIVIGNEKESVTTPFIIFRGLSISGIGIDQSVTLTVSPSHVAVNGDIDI